MAVIAIYFICVNPLFAVFIKTAAIALYNDYFVAFFGVREVEFEYIVPFLKI